MDEIDQQQQKKIDSLQANMEKMKAELNQLKGIVPEPVVPFSEGIVGIIDERIRKLINNKQVNIENLKEIKELYDLKAIATEMIKDGLLNASDPAEVSE